MIASESRTTGKFVAQALNLPSPACTMREALPPVQPQFLHLEMGIVILNLAGCCEVMGGRQSAFSVTAAMAPSQEGEGKEPTADIRPFVQLFMPHDFISPFTPPLRYGALFPLTDMEVRF